MKVGFGYMDRMFFQTLYGTAKLLLENREDYGKLLVHVATKCGAPEGGAAVLEAMLPASFDKAFSATPECHEARKKITRQQFDHADAYDA